MNLEQILLAISNTNDNELTIAGVEAAKENWSVFYPELVRLIDQFVADDTSLTAEQEVIVFFGTLLLAELKYSPALAKCLQLFARSDTFLTPIESIFSDAITELTATIFYNVADGNTQALSDYVVDGHQAMYCKASAMEAVFAQYEAGVIDKAVLSEQVSRWLAAFLALPSEINSFLISILADSCLEYHLDDFKNQFIALCDNNVGGQTIFDEDHFTESDARDWHRDDVIKLIESGLVHTNFKVVDMLKHWIENEQDDGVLDNMSNEGFAEFDSLMGEGGLLSNILYDENTILENSVPVSSIPVAGRNDPCPCGSGKKYKKCCIR